MAHAQDSKKGVHLKKTKSLRKKRIDLKGVTEVGRTSSIFITTFIIIAVVAVLTWIIPSGQYRMAENASGNMLPAGGTYSEIIDRGGESSKEFTNADGEDVVLRQDLFDVLRAPTTGIVGREAGSGHGLHSVESSFEHVLFILAVGGFLGVVAKTGALDVVLNRIARNRKNEQRWIIPLLMALLAMSGMIYGVNNVVFALYLLIVPLMLALGYNGMTAAFVVILGSSTGLIGSILNPLSIGFSSKLAELGVYEGNMSRVALFVTMLLVSTWFIMNYASKVRSGLHENDSVAALESYGLSTKNITFTLRRKLVLSLFAITFLIMGIAVAPWTEVFGVVSFEVILRMIQAIPGLGLLFEHATPFGAWSLGDVAILFTLMSFLIGFVYYYKNKQPSVKNHDVARDFLDGVARFLPVALIIGLVNGVAVIAGDGVIIDTIIHKGEQMIQGAAASSMPILSFILYLPLAFLVPSMMDIATMTMPIFIPLAEAANAKIDVLITAYFAAIVMVSIFAPTAISVATGLVVTKVSYITYIKRILPLLLTLFGVVFIILFVYAIFA